MPIFDKSAAAQAVESMGFNTLNRRLAQYWLSAWKADMPPSRGDIVPSKIKNLLPGIAILEFRKDETAICRLAGSAIAMAVGLDPTGRDIVALMPASFREERLARYRAVTAGAISRCVRRLLTRFDETIPMEDVQLPLSGAPQGTAHILYHADWRAQTLDRSKPEILRGLGTIAHETVSIVRQQDLRVAG